MSNIARVAGQAANTLTKPLEVEDVFSTYLYTGTGANQTITNGIDLSGEGGMTWIKRRNATDSHVLTDSERGYGQVLNTDTTGANQNVASLFNLSTTSSGFTIGSNNSQINNTSQTYASWTFRKAPKFFDVVTYTGNGSNTNVINHNLGAVPGFIIIKNTSTSGYAWTCQHRSLSSKYVELNNTNAAQNGYLIDPITSTTFNVKNNASVNGNGDTYVAYLFAHNDGDGEFGPDGDADIIKCGSYTGDGGAGTTEVNLGFEPQWILVKASSAADNWYVIDNMRGWATHNNTANDAVLYANATNAESTLGVLDITSTGFKTTLYSNANVSGRDYIYIAIRRGTAVPTSATEVFAIDTKNTPEPAYDSGFPVDMAIQRNLSVATSNQVATRLIQKKRLLTDSTNAEENSTTFMFDYNTGYSSDASNNASVYSWMWKRAPNYFDVVAYTGEGTKQTISHNLGVAPEMMWIKVRSTTQHWAVYHPDLPGSGKFISLNNNWDGNNTNSTFWDGETPTSTTFSVGATGVNNSYVNGSGNTYIAYLFATLAGISKVGSVTHSGTTNVDCGFTSGARFVLLKRTDATGDWYVWDSARGIVSGNDPYLLLNPTAAEVTNTDYIDPLSSGFTITDDFTDGDYIFYAIA